MTNTEILNAVKSSLPELEKQRQYILKIALTPNHCGRCGGAHTQVEASGLALDDYPIGVSTHVYHCPETGDEIDWILPWIGIPYFVLKRQEQGHGTRP